MVEAECLGEDPALWSSRFENELDYDRRVTVAKAICDECPIKAACYQNALGQDRADGIWGGVMFSDGKVGGRRLNPLLKRPSRSQEVARYRELGWSRYTIAEHLGISVEWVDRALQIEAAA